MRKHDTFDFGFAKAKHSQHQSLLKTDIIQNLTAAIVLIEPEENDSAEYTYEDFELKSDVK